MRKIFTSILAVIYLASSTGTALHFHYCMGKLANWGLSGDQSELCPSCGMEKGEADRKGCCKDEHKFIKNNSDQKISNNVFSFLKSVVINNPSIPVNPSDLTFYSTPTKIIPSKSPPGIYCKHIYILNCTYLI